MPLLGFDGISGKTMSIKRPIFTDRINIVEYLM